MVNVERVSPREAKALMDAGYTYVDVRSEQEFDLGHPTGAVNVPFLRLGSGGLVPNAEFLAVMERAFRRDAKIVVGCRRGDRSLRAAQTLLAAGFEHVADQRAGLDGVRSPFGAVLEAGWTAEGLPIERGARPEATYDGIKAARASHLGEVRGAG